MSRGKPATDNWNCGRIIALTLIALALLLCLPLLQYTGIVGLVFAASLCGWAAWRRKGELPAVSKVLLGIAVGVVPHLCFVFLLNLFADNTATPPALMPLI